MALAMNYQKYGTTFTNAYFQICVVQTNKTSGYTITVQVFFSAAAATSGVDTLANLSYQIPYVETIDLSGDGNPDMFVNPIAFGYALLKQRPEYATAVDA